jgi:murein peptide amidase A
MKKIIKSFITLILLIHSCFGLAESDMQKQLVNDECGRISKKLASVNLQDCLDNKLQQANGYSAEGAPILFREYAPISGKSPLGRVLLIGGIHGDEYSSVSIVFKWMKTLDEFHSGLFHWRILPVLNPDGLLRKKSQRMNANNVDLNRNFPMLDWKNATIDYWKNVTKSNPRRYPGKAALSESETQWLVHEINKFQPDVIVAVHAPHGIIDYDGPKNGPYKLGRLYLNLLGTYPGSLGNYAGVQKQIPVVTIELPYAGIMPTPAEIAHIWRDLVSWLSKNIIAENDVDTSEQ